MHGLTLLLLGVIAARALARYWLATRQIVAVTAHRRVVPSAFRDAVTAAEHETAAEYAIARARCERVAALTSAAVVLLLTLGGGIAAIDAAWRQVALVQPWLGVAVVLTVLGVVQLLGLPFLLWRTFRLDARFGFNRMTPRMFAADFTKRIAVAGAFAAPVLAVLVVLMERAGPMWWLPAWLAVIGAMLVVGWATPRFVAPLFNRFSPLEDPRLRQRLEALMRRCGFALGRVLVMDGSRRSAHGNAYFTGVGRHKRIVLFDTLLQRLAPSEVEAVLAHELGHFRLRHMHQRFALACAMSLGVLVLLAWLAADAQAQGALGVPWASAHGALALAMLVAPELSYFLRPITASWSRRQEFQADDFAARHANPAALASALVKIYRGNAATLTPDPLHSACYDTHPPPLLRIARLRDVGRGQTV